MKNKYLYSMKLYITRYCPLDCEYCFVKNKKKWLDMDFLVAKKSVDCFLSSDWFIKNIYFMWGEPFFKPKLLKQIIQYILNYNTNKSINIILVTSGIYKIDKYIEDLLCKYNNIKLSLSLDWQKSIHNKKRVLLNGLGSWDIIKNNIIKIKDNKNMCWTITVYENENVIKNLFKSFINLNRNFKFNYIHIWDVDWHKWDNKSILFYLREIRRIMKFMYQEEKKWNFIYLAWFNRYLMKNNSYLKSKTENYFLNNLKMFDVDYNGDVWKVMESINDKSQVYFNINETIDVDIILQEEWSWMKVFNDNWTDLNIYLHKIYSLYVNKFEEKYLKKLLDLNLYI